MIYLVTLAIGVSQRKEFHAFTLKPLETARKKTHLNVMREVKLVKVKKNPQLLYLVEAAQRQRR